MTATRSTASRSRRAGQFAEDVVAGLLDTVAERTDDYLDDTGVEPVHDLRVSLRRLRAVLSFLDPVLGERVALARGQIREQALDLGRLRDLDVFLEHLSAGTAPVADADAEALREVLVRRRDELAEQVSAQLGTRAWKRPLQTVRRATRGHNHREAAGKRATTFCRRRLDRWWVRWVVASADMPELAPHDLHRVRIRAKKLRYACEVSAELFDSQRDRAERTAEGFKDFQDLLGAANDLATARRIVEDAGFAVPREFSGHVDLDRAVLLRRAIILNGRFWRPTG